MKLTILGAGLSGISLAYFLQKSEEIEEINIIEKDNEIGGLCRSLKKDGYVYDIGPHILFSKDKEMLDLMLDMIPEQNNLKRSNQIIYKGRYITYPFENDLSKLPADDLNYCVTAFKNNPYKEYRPENMIQFFLKTFGEGITNTYLRPYNEKIWKYDLSFMDTQMVERIPQPTDEEIMRSAAGETVDGYIHQLYFHFPKEGGIESVVKGLADRLGSKCKIYTNQGVERVERKEGFAVYTNKYSFFSDKLITTIPIQEFVKAYQGVPQDVQLFTSNLRYNSIIIAFIKTKEDLSGENFAFMIPDKDIIFHRISKMDFLGDAYKSDGATYMVEITYRKGDYTDNLSDVELKERIVTGVIKLNFANKEDEVLIVNVTRHEYAYVLYDLHHKENMNAIRNYFAKEGVYLNGRFGNFEYWNMDRVLRESKKMAEELM